MLRTDEISLILRFSEHRGGHGGVWEVVSAWMFIREADTAGGQFWTYEARTNDRYDAWGHLRMAIDARWSRDLGESHEKFINCRKFRVVFVQLYDFYFFFLAHKARITSGIQDNSFSPDDFHNIKQSHLKLPLTNLKMETLYL